ncbi:hypothetical protein C8R44DRAFT_121267 [Mycena epipterygia]|nr:hypothetical protein C8R44DRAFT_121267 [Mycena epipterygia]
MESVRSAPILPPELERQIFEICALSRPVLIPKLMLVAWRVKEWIEPLLYRTITVDCMPIDGFPRFLSEILLPILETRPAVRDAVRNINLGRNVSSGVVERILSICTVVENVWVSSLGDHVTSIAPLLPKHLHIRFLPLLSTLAPSHPCFSQLTHLELLEPFQPDAFEIWAQLSLIPQLTHLSFNSPTFISLCPRLLETCTSLAVLVWLDRSDDMGFGPCFDVGGLSKDVRFVAMSCFYFTEDWQLGAHAGKNYWSRAETFIAKRRTGEIEALRYRLWEYDLVID